MKTLLMITIAGLIAVSGLAHAANGDLDLTFGNSHGVALSGAVGTTNTLPSQPVVQSDGKIVTCTGFATGGSSGTDFLVVRYNPDGSLDSSFSFDGRVTIAFAANGVDQCVAVAVQPNGKIAVAGFTSGASPTSTDFAIARLDSDGTLDTTFGAGTGKTTVGFDLAGGTGNDVATALALQSDGKIVVVGSAETSTTGTDFAVVRLLADGTRDPAFNLTGKVTIPFDLPTSTSRNDVAAAVAIDANGRIVLAGNANKSGVVDTDFAIARLLSNGQLDANFNSNGRATVTFDVGLSKGDMLYGMTLQQDGKIVLVGYSDVSPTATVNTDMSVARLFPDGSLDSSFGINGKTLAPFDLTANGQDLAIDVVEQSNRKLLIVGAAVGPSGANGAAVRLNPDGSFDNGFGTLGKHVYDDFGVTTPNSGLLRGVTINHSTIIACGLLNTDLMASTVDTFLVRLQDDLIFANGFQ